MKWITGGGIPITGLPLTGWSITGIPGKEIVIPVVIGTRISGGGGRPGYGYRETRRYDEYRRIRDEKDLMEIMTMILSGDWK